MSALFDAIFKFLAGLTAFYYDLVPNYGFAIVMLTVTVMLILLPLTWKSTRSMLAMQRLQPEMKRLQEKHKGDRQKLNEELMAFYKEHGINPLGGCLPMVLQMPVFIIMYRVIQGLTHTTHVNDVLVGAPKYISHGSDLYKALAKAGGQMKVFGVDLGRTASEKGAAGQKFVLLLMVAATVITQYVQTKQMSGRSTQQPNQQMVMMQRVMPAFFGLIALSMPGAVVLYFIVSNLFRVGQQEAMYRFDPTLAAHAAEAKSKNLQVKAEKAKAKPVNVEPKATRSDRQGSIGSGRATPRGGGNGRRPGSRPTGKRRKGR